MTSTDRYVRLFAITLFLIAAVGCAKGQAMKHAHSELEAVPFTQVKMEGFWEDRIKIIQKKTIPDLLDLAEEQGKIPNFAIVAGKKDGKIRLHNCPDSDVFKILEGASYSLAWRRNPELEKCVDEIIDLIAAAQQPDGYLNTQFSLPFDHPASPPKDVRHVKVFGYGPNFKWKAKVENWPKGIGQLYCAGHLMEGAVAHWRATGKRNFLNVAIKNADCIYDAFKAGKLEGYADHPQVEIGLFKLYEATGDDKYLELCDWITHNGKFHRPPDMGDGENAKPIEQQRKAWGHGVRINYLYAGATDVCRAMNQPQTREALDSLWHSIVDSRIYVHGGVGGPAHAEQLADDYNLHPTQCYCECCMNIAFGGQWNHRLNLMYGDAKYADLVEVEAYNGGLSGISLDGTKYFYTNKLNLTTRGRNNHMSGSRKRYLFCCPSKLPGFVAGIGRWFYAKDDRGIYVNMYAESQTDVQLNGQSVKLTQKTNYPWSGKVEIEVAPQKAGSFDLCLRIPGWAVKNSHIPGELYHFGNNEQAEIQVTVNGRQTPVGKLDKGYLRLSRKWKQSDKVVLDIAMPIRRVYADQRVIDVRGRVALMRGPLVYCLEGADHDFNVLDMVLEKDALFRTERRRNLLGGVTVIKGHGLVNGRKVEFTAVPYYSWQNRGIGELATWIIEDPEKADRSIGELKKIKHNING